MARTLRWGICGAGRIAQRFAKALAQSESGVLSAVGSRDVARAQTFIDELGPDVAPEQVAALGSYEQVAAADVDAVYVATIHNTHHEAAEPCLRAGRAVLIEKPIAATADQARRIVAAARDSGALCMEAMWTRFLPSIVRLRERLADGAIGELRMLQADFGFCARPDPKSRLLNPATAGGGLLDVGCYCISLASMLLGEPTAATGLAELHETGVDAQAGVVMQHPGGRLSVLSCGVRTRTPHEATLLGTDGYIRLHRGWWGGSEFTIHPADGEPETIDVEMPRDGFVYQIEEVARCVNEGLAESPTMGLDESVALLETMDALRRQWGVRYPFETEGQK